MRQGAVVLVLMAVMAGPAFAGGGSKADATINVTNNGTPAGGAVAAAVIVDPPAGFWVALGAAADPLAYLQSKGGQVIDFGKTKSFKVKAGAHVVSAVLYTLGPPIGSAGADATKTYTVAKGKTLALTVTDGATITP